VSLPRTVTAALACAALAVLAGCGSGGDGSGSSAAPTSAGAAASAAIPVPTKDDALAANVPQSVSADGKLVFGTDASYPPNEFTAPDGTTIVGMDVDLGTAVAQKLGLTAEFQNSAFPGIIPGIQGGKYELGMSSFTINPERVQTVDMVSYFSAGTSMAVKSGNPDNINPDDLCGKAVGVQAGTVQVDDINARNAKCTAEGKPAIQVTELQAQTDVTLALTANRIVAFLADSPVVDYAVKTTEGAIETVGQTYDTAPYGIALNKGQTEFAQACRAPCRR
jgi:polar amino acid transport system substrate-binding protein